MARSSRSFTLATQAAVAEEKATHDDLDYEFIDPDAEPPKGQKGPVKRVLIAHYPGEGAMFLMASSVGMSDAELHNPAGALFTFLQQVFSDDGDYRWLRKQVALNRLDPREQLMEMIGDMMSEWSGVPTRQ